MVEYINLILTNLILDLVIIFSIKSFFSLKTGNLFLMLLEGLGVVASIIYKSCNLQIYQFILIKLVANFTICLLSLDIFTLSKLIKVFFLHTVLSLSVYGFAALVFVFAKTALYETLGVTTGGILNFLLFFCIFLYVFLIYLLMRALSQHKQVQTYLKKVSFSLANQHIEFIGLLDSGNSLIDKRTGKPVVVVSTASLKDYLSKSDYERVKMGDFSPLGVSHQTSFMTAGESTSFMPISDIGSITIEDETGEHKQKCVLGFVNQNFAKDGGFDCLLHKDFM